MEQQNQVIPQRTYNDAATQELEYMYKYPLSSLSCEPKDLAKVFRCNVNRLLDQGADPNVSNGTEPLLSNLIPFSEQQCHIQLLQKMIAKGADVNRRDFKMNTPLIIAAYWSNFQATILLLENNADPKLINSDGHDAFHVAKNACFPKRKVIDILSACK